MDWSFLAFGVLSPWLLAGGLALSVVPFVIHLLHRPQHLERPWAAMQFLRAAVRTQSRRMRLESLVLLVVRTALIALAAVAVAQPFFSGNEPPAAVGAGTLRVLVIDVSLSMQAGRGDLTPLERARQSAERIVQTAPPGDSFCLVRIGRIPPFAVVPQAVQDRATILRQIQELRGTPQRADVAAALRTADECLGQSGAARREVIVLSDFQASNWWPDDPREREAVTLALRELAAESELTFLTVAGDDANNLAVTRVQPAWARPGSPSLSIEVEVMNAGAAAAGSLPVEAFAGDRLVGSGTLTVAAGETAAVRIALTRLAPTDEAVVVQIPEDVLRDDDRRWALLPERRGLDVLLVNGRPRTSDRVGAADFVQLALAPQAAESAARSASARTTVVGDGGLRTVDLGRFDCVFLCDVPQLDAHEAAQLRQYVAAGGGLVIGLGEQAQPLAWRRLRPAEGTGLLSGVLDAIIGDGSPEAEPVHFAPGDYQHPVIQPFAGNPDAGLLTTEVYRYWRVRLPESSEAEVALAYSTGDPAIIEHRLGAGRVLLVTTPFDERWSNWPLWPSFVPLVHELAGAAAAGRLEERQRLVGDAIVRRLSPEESGEPVQHEPPEGDPTPLRPTAGADGSGTVAVTAEAPGVHRLRLGEPPLTVERYAVNVDPVESRLHALDRAVLAELLLPGRSFRFAAEWQPQRAGAARGTRTDLARGLLMSLLALLLVEQAMAWSFRRGVAALVLAACGAGLALMIGRDEWVAAGLLTVLALLIVLRRRAGTRPDRRRARRATAGSGF